MSIRSAPSTSWQDAPAAAVAYSIVVPVYNEEENVEPLHQAIQGVADALPGSYEVIYVDDGSRDKSFTLLEQIAVKDPRIKLVQFRRNFGQTAAIAAGIEHANGDIIIFMDADLQNDPADVPLLLAKLDEGYDVVSGWRIKRQDALWTRKVPSWAANRLISWVTGVRLHDYGCSLKAYRREVIQQVHLYGEMHRFIPAYAAWVGARIAEVPVNHRARLRGTSKYGLSRTFKVALDLLTVKFLANYFTKPIYVFGGVGMALLGLSVLTILIALFQKLVMGVSLIQTPLPVLAGVLLSTGLIAILQGLAAEVSMRIYHESQRKPTYTVRRRVNLEPPDDLRRHW